MKKPAQSNSNQSDGVPVYFAAGLSVFLHLMLFVLFRWFDDPPPERPEQIDVSAVIVPPKMTTGLEMSAENPQSEPQETTVPDQHVEVEPELRHFEPHPILLQKTISPIAVREQRVEDVSVSSLVPLPPRQEETKVAVPSGMAAAANSRDGGDSLESFDAAPYSRRTIKPLYPYAARRQGREGGVELEVLISEKGRVTELRVVKSSGTPELDESAKQAVMKATFEPARLKGNAVPARVVLTIIFRLTN